MPINHGEKIRQKAIEFPLFAVMDADERLPVDFLKRTVAGIEAGNHAFIQASHVPNPSQQERFAREMGQRILPFWKLLLPIKNRYGCVTCVGHGVLVRRSAWKEVGGFPEVASEDLAFTAVLLGKGLRGHYMEEIACEEDFPASLKAFKKQQERYTAGVFQILTQFLPRLLRNPNATWVEKIDFLLSCLPLYVPVLSFFFLLTTGVGLPLTFGRFSHVEATTAFGEMRIPFVQAFDGRFAPLWGNTFVWLSVLLRLRSAARWLRGGSAGDQPP